MRAPRGRDESRGVLGEGAGAPLASSWRWLCEAEATVRSRQASATVGELAAHQRESRAASASDRRSASPGLRTPQAASLALALALSLSLAPLAPLLLLLPRETDMAPDTAHRRAWVTLLTNDRYLPGLVRLPRPSSPGLSRIGIEHPRSLPLHTQLVLDHTMKQVGTKYPLVVLTTPSFPDEHLDLLQALVRPSLLSLSVAASTPTLSAPRAQGMRTKRIELLEPRGEMMLIAERFKDTWSKLQAFALTEYERVVLLDCDMSVLSPIDSLLSDDSLLPSPSWIAAAHSCVCNPLKQDFYLPDCVPSNCAYTHAEHHSGAPPPVDLLPTKRTYGLLNSGLVVLCPSAELYNSIVHHLHTSPTVAQMALPDQDLLGEVFDGRWVPLEWRFNAIKTFRWVHPELWFAAEEVDGKEGRRLEGRERNEQTGNGVAVLHYIVEKPVRVSLSLFSPLSLSTFRAPTR